MNNDPNAPVHAVVDGFIDGYNFAPFEVRPWTNWPDVYNNFLPDSAAPLFGNIRIAETNPVGNPGFGDSRWLRSTEPVRVVYQGQPAFSHWSHLSWIPTANNGWRLVTDISDVAKFTLTEVAPSQRKADFFPTIPKRWSLEIPYEQWLPSVPPDPNLWVPITFGTIPPTPLPPFPNLTTPQGDAAFTWLLEQRFKDTLCGTKVMFRKDYIKLIKNRTYFGEFDPFGDFDLLFGAHKLNLKIVEVPIRYKERTYGETNISRFKHGIILLRMCAFASRKCKFI